MTGVLDVGRLHLVGVGGAGMSVVAALLRARGIEVSGSDARESAVLGALRLIGVDVQVGHAAEHVAGAGGLVVSSAVRDNNVELVEARRRSLPVWHRSEALAALMAGHRAVAVAGAHGKTTTAAMIATVLRDAGRDPSFAVGAAVRGVESAVSGAHHGSGDVFVAEADESDGSFLNYRPTIAVVTNVEPDHLDHYGDQAAFEEAFEQFAARIVPGGWLVACADDPGARRLLRHEADRQRALRGTTRVLSYGTAPDADLHIGDYRPTARAGAHGAELVLTSSHPVLAGPTGRLRQRVVLSTPGEHNARNAAAAWAVGRLLGVSAEQAADGLAEFVGTGRRFEERGRADGVRVIDDYAHHPTEVEALLRAARPVATGGRVLVLFQPHLFSRTRTFAREFGRALRLADVVVLTDIYAAREDPVPGVDAGLIAEQVPAGTEVHVVPERTAAARRVAELARPGDLVLTVGAGDVTEFGPVVLEVLARRAGTA